MYQKKICLIGGMGVGKTSLVAQFVKGIFSEDYHSTIGVKIDRKSVIINEQDVNMIIWDLAGEDMGIPLRTSFLNGSSGFIFVADGTRMNTVELTRRQIQYVKDLFPNIPSVTLINKSDLTVHDDIETPASIEVTEENTVFQTSAKTGKNVEEAFQRLAEKMMRTTASSVS